VVRQQGGRREGVVVVFRVVMDGVNGNPTDELGSWFAGGHAAKMREMREVATVGGGCGSRRKRGEREAAGGSGEFKKKRGEGRGGGSGLGRGKK
ncbi:hypothetical protein HAX54_000195, partial [Datura stramonium]|nr:hypothetical protein [Datura stramonium]